MRDKIIQRIKDYLLFKIWLGLLIIGLVFILGAAFGVFWLQEVMKGHV
jgi:uncharacterized protein YneF (UPF0154 family)